MRSYRNKSMHDYPKGTDAGGRKGATEKGKREW